MNNKIATQQTWLQLASIQIAGAICLPIIMIGQQIGKTYDFTSAVISIMLGNFFLFTLATSTVLMAYRYKDYTIANAMRYFGKYGTMILGFNMLISLTGWFAIQLNVISLSIEKSIALLLDFQIPVIALNIIIGSLITIASLYGIKSIEKLATISLPFFIGTMAVSLYQAIHAPAISQATTINSYQGISLVIACGMMAVIDLPTYYRFARSNKDSVMSVALLFIVAIPVLEIIGAYMALHSSGSNILDTLTSNQNVAWQLWVFLFLILAGWTTNNMNLYSATTAFDYIAPRLGYVKQTLLLGIIGIAISCFDILSNLEQILSGIGILISSMGGVIISNYAIKQWVKNNTTQIFFIKNIIAWCFGSSIGFVAFFGFFSITNFDIIDAYIASSIATCIMQLFKD